MWQKMARSGSIASIFVFEGEGGIFSTSTRTHVCSYLLSCSSAELCSLIFFCFVVPHHDVNYRAKWMRGKGGLTMSALVFCVTPASPLSPLIHYNLFPCLLHTSLLAFSG